MSSVLMTPPPESLTARDLLVGNGGLVIGDDPSLSGLNTSAVIALMQIELNRINEISIEPDGNVKIAPETEITTAPDTPSLEISDDEPVKISIVGKSPDSVSNYLANEGDYTTSLMSEIEADPESFKHSRSDGKHAFYLTAYYGYRKYMREIEDTIYDTGNADQIQFVDEIDRKWASIAEVIKATTTTSRDNSETNISKEDALRLADYELVQTIEQYAILASVRKLRSGGIKDVLTLINESCRRKVEALQDTNRSYTNSYVLVKRTIVDLASQFPEGALGMPIFEEEQPIPPGNTRHMVSLILRNTLHPGRQAQRTNYRNMLAVKPGSEPILRGNLRERLTSLPRRFGSKLIMAAYNSAARAHNALSGDPTSPTYSEEEIEAVSDRNTTLFDTVWNELVLDDNLFALNENSPTERHNTLAQREAAERRRKKTGRKVAVVLTPLALTGGLLAAELRPSADSEAAGSTNGDAVSAMIEGLVADSPKVDGLAFEDQPTIDAEAEQAVDIVLGLLEKTAVESAPEVLENDVPVTYFSRLWGISQAETMVRLKDIVARNPNLAWARTDDGDPTNDQIGRASYDLGSNKMTIDLSDTPGIIAQILHAA